MKLSLETNCIFWSQHNGEGRLLVLSATAQNLLQSLAMRAWLATRQFIGFSWLNPIATQASSIISSFCGRLCESLVNSSDSRYKLASDLPLLSVDAMPFNSSHLQSGVIERSDTLAIIRPAQEIKAFTWNLAFVGAMLLQYLGLNPDRRAATTAVMVGSVAWLIWMLQNFPVLLVVWIILKF